jgi:hypothetical protein
MGVTEFIDAAPKKQLLYHEPLTRKFIKSGLIRLENKRSIMNIF